MNKTLKIKGNSGLIDLLGVLEYAMAVIEGISDTNLTVEWTRWDEEFDRLIQILPVFNYVKNKNCKLEGQKFVIDAKTKDVNSNTPAAFYQDLFKRYDLIELWDNRTIACNYPSPDIFNKIAFAPEIYDEINGYKKILGENYIAFHGRFTDFPYTSTHISTFKQHIFETLNQTECNILLCTDNQIIISEFLTIPRVYNFSYIKKLLSDNIILPRDQGIHLITNDNIHDFHYKIHKSAIIDFLLCVMSKHFHGSNGGYSKFIKTVRSSSNILDFIKR